MDNKENDRRRVRNPEPVQEMYAPAGQTEPESMRVAYGRTTRRRNTRLSPPSPGRRRRVCR